MLKVLFGPIIDIVKTVVEGKVIRSKARVEAETSAMLQASKSQADWEAYMAQNSGQSWKDEWLTILFSVPLILAFVPNGEAIVMRGFEVLEKMPDWYQYTLSVIVAASFGVRSVIGLMNKKGKKNGS
jgi:hypothetical protein